MAAKKATKKKTKTDALASSSKKKAETSVSEPSSRKKAVKKTPAKKSVKKTAKKTTKKEDKITIKTSHLFTGIVVVGLIIIAVLLAKNLDFSNSPKVTILSDKDCVTCNSAPVEQALAEMFPEAEIVKVDVKSSRGKALVNTGIPGVPAYFLDKELSQNEKFKELVSQLSDAFIETDEGYYVNPGIPGINPSKLYVELDTGDRPILGDVNAPETIIEFSDFECPFCKRFYDTTYKELKEQYIETGKANLVFMHFPLGNHQNAKPAAMAAECANDQGKFWEMHDKLFENQDKLSTGNYVVWAAELGMNSADFKECLDSNKHSALVDSHFQKGIEVYVGGTPSFIVDSHLIVGAQAIGAFNQILG